MVAAIDTTLALVYLLASCLPASVAVGYFIWPRDRSVAVIVWIVILNSAMGALAEVMRGGPL